MRRKINRPPTLRLAAKPPAPPVRNHGEICRLHDMVKLALKGHDHGMVGMEPEDRSRFEGVQVALRWILGHEAGVRSMEKTIAALEPVALDVYEKLHGDLYDDDHPRPGP